MKCRFKLGEPKHTRNYVEVELMVDIAQVSQCCAGLSQRPAVSPATVVPPVFLHLDPRSDYVSLFRGVRPKAGCLACTKAS
jgi:hypothetical protein